MGGYGTMPVTYSPVETDTDASAVRNNGTTNSEERYSDNPEQQETLVRDSSPEGSNNNTNDSSDGFAMGLAFWVLGLLNNSSYVIMIASAKTISEGGTGLVFLANVIPSLAIKISAPYWFDFVSYQKRMMAAFGLMVLSFGLVASLSTAKTAGSEASFSMITVCKLIGVAMASSQCGLGEASLLAAAGKVDTSGQGVCITCFSSGTGLAGVFGFLWKFIFNEWLEFSMSTTLWLAQSLALAYISIFIRYLHSHLDDDNDIDDNCHNPHHMTLVREEQQPLELTTYSDNLSNDDNLREEAPTERTTDTEEDEDGAIMANVPQEDPTLETSTTTVIHTRTKPLVHQMSFWERTKFFTTLWPYVIPLFVVYLTEYSLQAGTWTAIGFPVSSEQARDEFYEYSNWMYQLGVFVSRSSGAIGTAPMTLLWLMPGLQTGNVIFFAYVAAEHFWYNYSLLVPCFYVGLLGGAVYVHGYKRICADFDCIDRREFALAATSVAEGFGTMCADFVGIFIQSCLYRSNRISGGIVSCPIPMR